MRITQILHRQHMDRAVRWLWQMKREQTIPIAPSINILKSMGYQLEDANELMKETTRKAMFQKVDVPPQEPLVEVEPEPVKDFPVSFYEPKYVLQAGLDQARILTNSTVMEGGLPKRYQLEEVPGDLNLHLQRTIANSAIFDAHQEKLPKLKDPVRRMFVFPRVYGITQYRKTHNIVMKLLQICENVCGPDVTGKRVVDFNTEVSVRMERLGRTLQGNVGIETLLRSTVPLEPIDAPGLKSNYEMPNIYPMEPFISIPITNVEKDVKTNTWEKTKWKNMHTLFVYHDPESVQNLTELPVSEDQILGRTLMNVFTVAANSALNTNGEDLDRLSKPLTVQCVQTDGQDFIFSVFQLNGMNDDLINYWWLGPKLRLYEKAQYENGRPAFTEYNEDVFKSLLAFYRQ